VVNCQRAWGVWFACGVSRPEDLTPHQQQQQQQQARGSVHHCASDVI